MARKLGSAALPLFELAAVAVVLTVSGSSLESRVGRVPFVALSVGTWRRVGGRSCRGRAWWPRTSRLLFRCLAGSRRGRVAGFQGERLCLRA